MPGPHRFSTSRFLLVAGAVICLLTPTGILAQETSSVRLRGSLDHCRTTFQTHRRGTVAFMGGSITEMNGYRPMVMESLEKRFPDTKFTFVNAGISSTCSHTGAFRLTRDVLAEKPDLLFVEFAVNDDQDAAHSKTEAIRGMEGLIRHARTARPEMDIVVTHFVNPSMLATVQAGKVPLSIAAHETVTQAYEVSSCNVAQELAKRIAAGSMTWALYGGTHPKPAGNRIAADLVDELLDQAWAKPATVMPRTPLPATLDGASYTQGRFLLADNVSLGAGWTRSEPDWQKVGGALRKRFAGLTLTHADQPGATMKVRFQGSALGIYVLAGPDAGTVEFSVDGGPLQRKDLYHRFSKSLHYPRTVVLAAALDDGDHVITIRVANDKHENSKGTAVRIVEFAAS